jgi:hypothetical protein
MSDQTTQDGQGNRPEADGPEKPKPPADETEPSHPEKTSDVHGDPETPV